MSAFLCPLWVLGINNANPGVSLEAEGMQNGVTGLSLALSASVGALLPKTSVSACVSSQGARIGRFALVGTDLPMVSRSATIGSGSIRWAMSLVQGNSGSLGALPVRSNT